MLASAAPKGIATKVPHYKNIIELPLTDGGSVGATRVEIHCKRFRKRREQVACDLAHARHPELRLACALVQIAASV